VPLVLADQQMPGMSGTQLLARVRQFFPMICPELSGQRICG
jgi:CheY-like chemotaxis protein